ncbi:HU family DNA-binding protein [Kingella negevensis]|uniref:HU family DNA-binding protein n=1 Tax=Kingella negevensis TaxID=1522312 RepID=UPI00254CFA5A|nr:HU family DNA-binding protein [Kingella negevensis]MDK4680431.1 HU family DNA-binding protein [Kingella negevensis]MDK4681846.1 HU family DNA-binding protein [Kingella negevensis]MDK4690043.1 HU family DNA-binding protein [Kingella negevensis]MDK4692611.1 HU family DNA-binding protein [Kingella negevensis]MDK4698910.1 HU family DNA-binding protein [Kingella negevensis]
MNKSELVKTIAARAGLTQTQAGHALDAFCATVIDELGKGGEVHITGFGVFKTQQRAARKGMNIKTKEPITIAASTAPKFTAGKALKDAVA